ncbi:MAG: dockerin type I domain-containing protein [Acutalibacteraceae bacterium]
MKKVISIFLAIALAATTFAIAATMSASAESNNVYYWSAFNRHYGWSEWPQTVTYTDGGSVTIEDTGRFLKQYQLHYAISSDEDKATMLNMVKTACDDYDGQLSLDIKVFRNSNTNFDKIEENQSARCQIIFAFKAFDVEEGEFVNDSWAMASWFAADSQVHTLTLSVDDYSSWYSDPDYYKDFEVTDLYLQYQNYSCNAVKDVEVEYEGQTFKPGTVGLGFTKITTSALYINGDQAPAEGNDIGKGYEFIPNENREQITNPKNGMIVDKYPGTFIFDGKYYLQNDDGSMIDGPLGNGADIVRVPVEPDPTEPDPTKPDPTEPDPTEPDPTKPDPTEPDPTKPTDPPATALFGDANEDGNINMLDVLLIRKYIAKQPVTPNLVNSDVTHEGSVNMIDVLKIRKYIAKQPVDLSRVGNV